MKINAIILFFCLSFQLVWAGQAPSSFHNSKINIPSGFKMLTDEAFSIFKATIFDRKLMQVYEQKSSTNGLQRIIIYYDSLSEINTLSFENIVKLKLEVTNEQGINFNEVKTDNLNHCVFGRSIIKGDTSLFGFSIDNNGIMGLQYDNSNGISSKDKQLFSQLIRSIKHASPYHFQFKENSETQKAKKDMEYSGIGVTIGLIAMLVIGLLRKYIAKNK